MKRPGLRFLTVHQPYASLIARGLKPVEIRPGLTHHRGELAILAGQTWSVQGALNPGARQAWLDWTQSIGQPGALCPGAPGLEVGGVIAVVDVVGCHLATRVTRTDGSDGGCCEPWANRLYGSWHWELGNARLLDTLVRCRGKQGIGILSETLEGLVRVQL